MDLRTKLFGDRVQSIVDCVGCGCRIELGFALDDLRSGSVVSTDRIDLSADGFDVQVRPLTAGDLLVAWTAHDVLHLRQLTELRYALIARAGKPFSPAYAGDW